MEYISGGSYEFDRHIVTGDGTFEGYVTTGPTVTIQGSREDIAKLRDACEAALRDGAAKVPDILTVAEVRVIVE